MAEKEAFNQNTSETTRFGWHIYQVKLDLGMKTDPHSPIDVKRAEESAKPAYPNRKEFQRNRHLLGAAVLGAGMVMSACNKRHVPPPERLSGLLPQFPQTKKEGQSLPPDAPPPR